MAKGFLEKDLKKFMGAGGSISSSNFGDTIDFSALAPKKKDLSKEFTFKSFMAGLSTEDRKNINRSRSRRNIDMPRSRGNPFRGPYQEELRKRAEQGPKQKDIEQMISSFAQRRSEVRRRTAMPGIAAQTRLV